MKASPPHASGAVLGPLHEFLRKESAGGLILMAVAVLALLVANSPLAGRYTSLQELPVVVGAGEFVIAKPLLLWINDGLMAVFFLLIGLELKREVREGHLSSWRTASLPAFAATGGMLVPGLIYAAFNSDDPIALQGWAIPTATDIAFALGVLSLLGNRVPAALKVLLLSVAIFDDLGAVVVIAAFYTADLSWLALSIAVGLIAVLACLNRAGVTKPAAYLWIGVPLWVAVLKSGVHATLAGVVLAMFIPLRGPHGPPNGEPSSPLRRLEHALHPWVAFGILPVFAFVNAGVSFGGLTWRDASHPVALGIVAGLLIGKQLGVFAFCWIATRVGLASLPAGVGWRQVHGTALLCGIGFTMSLFIASLAFEHGGAAFVNLDRLGILAGSAVSGALGYFVLRSASSSRR